MPSTVTTTDLRHSAQTVLRIARAMNQSSRGPIYADLKREAAKLAALCELAAISLDSKEAQP